MSDLLGGSFLGNHGHGINLHPEIGVRQCRDKDARDDGWVRTLAPDFLERFEPSVSRLALQDVHVPLDDMLELSPSSRQCGFQVPQSLLRLRS